MEVEDPSEPWGLIDAPARPPRIQTVPLRKAGPRFSSWEPMELGALEGTVADGEEVATIEFQRDRQRARSAMSASGLERIADFGILKPLGHQSGIDFYLAERPSALGTSLRVIIKHLPKSADKYAQRRQRLIREARISERFKHPNLVPLLDAGEDESGCYLLIEDVLGTNLARATERLRERAVALPIELIVWCVSEVLHGLSFAHCMKDGAGRSLGLVLSDIVPSNVLITNTGQVKLASFALQIVPGGAESTPLPGAAAYLAPERIARARCGASADIYAAGMLLYELLAGQTALQRFAPPQVLAKLVHEGLPLGILAEEKVPKPLIDVVERATQRRPEDRFQGAAQMASALDAWLESASHRAGPSTIVRFFVGEKLYEPQVDEAEQVELPEDTIEQPLKAHEEGYQSQTLSAIIVEEKDALDGEFMPRAIDRTLEVDLEKTVTKQEEDAARFGTIKDENVADVVSLFEAAEAMDSLPSRVSGLMDAPFDESEDNTVPAPDLSLFEDAFDLAEPIQAEEIVERFDSVPPEALRAPVALPDPAQRKPISVVEVQRGPGGWARLLIAVALGLTVAGIGWMASLERKLEGQVLASGPLEAARAVPGRAPRSITEVSLAGAKGEVGELVLYTFPSVKVFHGPVLMGTTPLRLSLPKGTHQLRFSDRAGGLSQTKIYDVNAGQQAEDRLTFGESELLVRAPEGARVFLGKRLLGVAPVKAVRVFSGVHRVKVETEAHTFAGRVKLAEGRRVEYEVKLR